MNLRTFFGRRAVRAVLAMLAGVLVLSGCSVYSIPLPGGADVGSNPTTLHIMFRDVLDLVPQSTVKVDDVTVGRVTKIKLHGYTADVTVKIPSDMKIATNERVTIDQTSLLGEKFVNLRKPANPSGQYLSSGDTIPLSQTGRNPEVEEVLQALSALLNGGGVGQLKTIAHELNTAVGGREQDVRAVIDQIHTFMGVLDANKQKVVGAIEGLNTLSASIRKQDGTIKQTLADMPSALKSVNTQRADLRKLLGALSRLSNVGVKVIKASKEATINSLSDLAPVLTAFAKSGQALPKSLQVILTYPFIDAAVGNSPEVARNLHLGDFTNLNATLNLDLKMLAQGIGLPKMDLPSLVNMCQTNVPAGGQQACDLLDTLSSSLCGNAALANTPLCNAWASSDPSPTVKSNAAKKSAAASGGAGSKAADQNAVNQVTGILGNLLGNKTPSGSTATGGSSSAGGSGAGTSGGSGSSGSLGSLLGGLGLGRPAPSVVTGPRDEASLTEATRRLHNLAGIGRLLLQGVYTS